MLKSGNGAGCCRYRSLARPLLPILPSRQPGHALDQSGHAPVEISGVFHTKCFIPKDPDGWPAQHYINRNTINQPVASVEIRNGCVGFFSAMHLAVCYLNATPDRTAALLTAADNFGTPSVNRWHASKLFVLADGGAIVLSKRRGFAKVLATGSASNPELEQHHRGAESLFPPSLTVGGTLNFEERMASSQQDRQRARCLRRGLRIRPGRRGREHFEGRRNIHR